LPPQVERILEVQFLRNGKKEFLVQWKGFGKNGSTWEPEDNLADCKGLLQAFMAKLESVSQGLFRINYLILILYGFCTT